MTKLFTRGQRKGKEMTTTMIDNKTIELIASYIQIVKLSQAANSDVSAFAFNLAWDKENQLQNAGLTLEQIGMIAKAVR